MVCTGMLNERITLPTLGKGSVTDVRCWVESGYLMFTFSGLPAVTGVSGLPAARVPAAYACTSNCLGGLPSGFFLEG